jgi:hypothetical protein
MEKLTKKIKTQKIINIFENGKKAFSKKINHQTVKVAPRRHPLSKKIFEIFRFWQQLKITISEMLHLFI